jgi:agmatine deiminase
MLPAEWERQKAVWFTWPQNMDTWAPVEQESKEAYRAMVREALKRQDVVVLVNDKTLRVSLEKEFARDQEVSKFQLDVFECKTNDSWIRDYGAVTVRASDNKSPAKLVALDFAFNSWGGKYPPWDADDAVPVFMAGIRDREILTLDFVLEGGSIDVNGEGILLTTSQCLLNKNRNPDMGRTRIEEVLHSWLGADEVIWLESGIHGDDTDGHVDDLARFADPRTVLCAIEADKQDENFQALKSNMDVLNKFAKKGDIEVVEMPMPAKQVKADLRTPATYMNFLILNDAVLAPVYLDKHDDKALAVLEKSFPDRVIVPIDCRGLVFGQGAIHCSSMQEPLA